MALLSVNSVEVVYDQVSLAVKGASLEVPQAGLVALLGANGAGKSTILKSISGLLAPERGAVTRGTITFEGEDILALDPPTRVRRGIVHVLEGRKVFEHLTPLENLLAATTMYSDRAKIDEMAEQMFELFPRLKTRAKAKAGYLSGGEQQMLAIARALARDIKVLLLDEPYEGLAPVIVQEIAKTLAVIRDQGITTVIVEQNAVAALKLADRAVILDTGTVVYDGSAEEVLNDEALRAQYLAI